MSTSKAAINFDQSLPKTYSDFWREAYGQESDTPRLTSYQAPGGEPVVFACDSVSLGGGQNVDTAEYPYGFWSNVRLGEKPHTLRIKGHLIGESYIGERNKLVAALQAATDDDNPGFIDLPLWGRFKVVVESWGVAEEKQKTGMSDLSIELKRAGYSDSKRLADANENVPGINKAVSSLKDSSVSAFAKALSKTKDIAKLTQCFGKMSSKLQEIVGRVQGAENILNSMTNNINNITNLLAQAVMSPRALAQAFVSAAYGIVAGIMEICNAVDATASYFMGSDDDDDDFMSIPDGGSSSSGGGSQSGGGASSGEQSSFGETAAASSVMSKEKQESVMREMISRNEKNVLGQLLTAANFSIDEDSATVSEQSIKSAAENLYKATAFGMSALLITRTAPEAQTHKSRTRTWELLSRLEDSIDKEDHELFAAVEEVRIACAETLALYGYDVELSRRIRRNMPLLDLATYLGCDESKIRSLNSVSDSFLIKGDVIYV